MTGISFIELLPSLRPGGYNHPILIVFGFIAKLHRFAFIVEYLALVNL
jgi:hypothetical protein